MGPKKRSAASSAANAAAGRSSAANAAAGGGWGSDDGGVDLEERSAKLPKPEVKRTGTLVLGQPPERDVQVPQYRWESMPQTNLYDVASFNPAVGLGDVKHMKRAEVADEMLSLQVPMDAPRKGQPTSRKIALLTGPGVLAMIEGVSVFKEGTDTASAVQLASSLRDYVEGTMARHDIVIVEVQASPALPRAGEAVVFEAVVSQSGPIGNVAYTWSFGDGPLGTVFETCVPRAEHVYDAGGHYVVGVTAQPNRAGGSAVVSTPLRVIVGGG
jgi:hypothetical protein